jgi:RNA polymerase sigma-70 factor (ECF subfamily)
MALGESFTHVLDAARAGGEWAWTQIYRDLAPVLLGYLRSQGSRDPEDLVGEVFVQVVRKIHTFEGDEAGFRSWVFVIAHHRLADESRRLRRRPQPVPGEALDRPAPDDVSADALDRLATDRVRAVIEPLPAGQRDVLLLRLIGGLTIEEISKAIGKRRGAVKALQRRGLAAIKRQLEDATPERDDAADRGVPL